MSKVKMLRIAHRGASGYEPENTLRAFKKALDLGVDMIELDVRQCKSGELVVVHDKFIITRKLNVTKLTLRELRLIVSGIPTLQEALAIIPRHVKIDIDIKDTKATDEVLRLVRREVELKGRAYTDFLISCYNFFTIAAINRKNPSIPTSLISFFFPTINIRLAARLGTNSVQIRVKNLSQKTIDFAHQFGLSVYAWVANEPEEIEKIKKMRVDGIISDFPDRI